MLKIVTALPPQIEQNLLPEMLNSGHQVVARAADAGEVLSKTESEHVDLVLLHPQLKQLSVAVLNACEQRGIRVMFLVADLAEEEAVHQLGYVESYPQSVSWSELSQASGLLGPGYVIPPRRAQRSERSAPRIMTDVAHQPAKTSIFVPPSMARDAEPEAKLVAVWGPQGSPGRTTVAMNYAHEVARNGKQVLLIDADTYASSMVAMLGLVEESSTLAQACRLVALEQLTEAELERLMNRHQLNNGVRLLTGIINAKRWPELEPNRIRQVLEMALQLVDCVVVDIGFSLENDEMLSTDLLAPKRNGAALTTLEHADLVLAVCAAGSVGIGRFIRGLTRLTELVSPESIHTVLNRAPRQSTKQAEMVDALRRFAGIYPVVNILDDPAVFARAEERGGVVSGSSPSNIIAQAFRTLVEVTAQTPSDQ